MTTRKMYADPDWDNSQRVILHPQPHDPRAVEVALLTWADYERLRAGQCQVPTAQGNITIPAGGGVDLSAGRLGPVNQFTNATPAPINIVIAGPAATFVEQF